MSGDGSAFDNIARRLAQPTPRRTFLQQVGAVAASWHLAAVGLSSVMSGADDTCKAFDYRTIDDSLVKVRCTGKDRQRAASAIAEAADSPNQLKLVAALEDAGFRGPRAAVGVVGHRDGGWTRTLARRSFTGADGRSATLIYGREAAGGSASLAILYDPAGVPAEVLYIDEFGKVQQAEVPHRDPGAHDAGALRTPEYPPRSRLDDDEFPCPCGACNYICSTVTSIACQLSIGLLCEVVSEGLATALCIAVAEVTCHILSEPLECCKQCSKLPFCKCPHGQAKCNGECVDLHDHGRCTFCSEKCFDHEVCLPSGCCPSSQVCCDKCCPDAKHCDQGTCTCIGGSDPCAEALLGSSCGGTCCDGLCCEDVCVDSATDTGNCGGCGIQCDPGEICCGGNCIAPCGEGTNCCGGACIELPLCTGCLRDCQGFPVGPIPYCPATETCNAGSQHYESHGGLCAICPPCVTGPGHMGAPCFY